MARAIILALPRTPQKVFGSTRVCAGACGTEKTVAEFRKQGRVCRECTNADNRAKAAERRAYEKMFIG